MKIAVLSGSVKNSGDFLIVRRSKDLLRYIFPEAELCEYTRNRKLTVEQINEINTMDFIVFAGGPFYRWDIYPNTIPLCDDLLRLKPKMFMLGGGWRGNTTHDSEVRNYKFSSSSQKLLHRVQSDTRNLGCRDFYAVKVLKGNGIDSAVMTGCPAWYDISKINEKLSFPEKIKKIAVSDPADIFHFGDQSLKIVEMLKEKFPDAQIIYLFHRGMAFDQYTDDRTAKKLALLQAELEKLQVPCFDIAYSDEGFSRYDDCDLHIGHRVHAHIYNLSQRHLSILIEEDSRGAGVNEALSLWSIRAYGCREESFAPFWKKVLHKIIGSVKCNPYCTEDVARYIDYILYTRGKIFNIAFGIMQDYFEIMCAHIASMKCIFEKDEK